MRAIPDSLDPEIVDAIDTLLDDIERRDGVRVPWAIESGSRAWGFPSPDSDYDCRFFYVRPADDYLSPWERRDVIETPPDGIFDVNGWDLAKALRLLVKGNATVTEWLRSPIVYRGEEAFQRDFLDLAEQIADRELIGRHYLHVGRRQLQEAGTAPLKRVFYALRPAAILRWMRVNASPVIPPMTLQEALAECGPRADVVAATTELLDVKARTRELGRGEIPTAIQRFIDEEFEHAEARYADPVPEDRADAIARCEEFFRRVVA